MKLLTLLAAMCIAKTDGQHFDCPLARHLSPCSCAERQHGLEVTCREVSALQLREVLDLVALTRQTVWFLRVERGSPPLPPLKDLRVLNAALVDSELTSLDPPLPEELESLDLGGNALKRVPSEALAGLGQLAALSLERNSIERLDAHAFAGLRSLLWLSLSGNRIRTVDGRAFAGTEASLTRLDLGRNRLGTIPRYALRRLSCLQGLRLHENNISEVFAESLPNSLCDLDLSGNRIDRLEPETFATLPKLSALDLEDNQIRSVHKDAFTGIHHSLEWLKLGGNEMTSIPHFALRNLTRLRQLDLRGNLISIIDMDSFHIYGRTLKFIFLQKNSIQTIEEGALDVLESVEWLYLHSNELSRLHYDTLKGVIDNVHVIDLHDNPFHCDCNVLWFRDWLLAKGQNIANLPKETRCRSPEEHALKPIVKLANSSFVCSSGCEIARKLTNNFGILLSLLLSLIVFLECR